LKKIAIYAVDIFHGDAVGNYCFSMKETLVGLGLHVELFSTNFESTDIKSIDHLEKNQSKFDLIIFHYSIYDSNLNFFISNKEKVCIYFHNVTPPELVSMYSPELAEICRKSYKQIERLIQFKFIITNSIKSKALLVNDYGFDEKKISTIAPISKTQLSKFQFHKKNKKLEKQKLKFLIVGRIVPHKNIEEGIRIFNKFNIKYPLSTLRIIGGYDESSQYFNDLISLVNSLNLENKIKFYGFLPDSELIDIYNNSNILVHPSMHEGFGLPLLEAFKAKVLVFCRRNIISKDLIENNEQTYTDIDTAQIFLSNLNEDKFNKIILRQNKTLMHILKSIQCEIYKNIFIDNIK
jgi:glycosyltransferase involved in cell wall biosynthesis